MGGKNQGLWRGAFLITGAAFIGKVLSALYRVPYQNLSGDQGLYVHQQIYPFYGAAMVISLYGFPVVISKMVMESYVRDGQKEAKETAYAAFVTLLATHSLLFILMFYKAESLAALMGDERLSAPLRSMSFILLLIPFYSAIRGYYQGIEDMRPTALSHLIEQIIRVSAVLLLTGLVVFAGNDAYAAGHAAAIGSILGSTCGVVFLLSFFLSKKEQKHHVVHVKAILKQVKTNHVMISRGILVSCGAMIFIMYQFIDAFTVARMLTSSGMESGAAKTLKGVFDRGQPLLQFGTVISTSFAMAIVPLLRREELAENREISRYYATLAVRVSLLIGTAAAIGLMVIAEPVNIMLFENADGTGVLMILAGTLVMSGLVMTTSAVMQGHDQFGWPALFLVAGLLTKTVGNVLLLPLFDVRGAAVATVTGMAVTGLCNLRFILHRKFVSLPSLFWVQKAALSLLGMGVAVFVLKYTCDLIFTMDRMKAALIALLTAGCGVFLFLWWIVKRMPLFTKEERMLIPGMDQIESLFKRKEK